MNVLKRLDKAVDQLDKAVQRAADYRNYVVKGVRNQMSDIVKEYYMNGTTNGDIEKIDIILANIKQKIKQIESNPQEKEDNTDIYKIYSKYLKYKSKINNYDKINNNEKLKIVLLLIKDVEIEIDKETLNLLLMIENNNINEFNNQLKEISYLSLRTIFHFSMCNTNIFKPLPNEVQLNIISFNK